MAGHPIARKHRKLLDKLGEEEILARLAVSTVREFCANVPGGPISPPRLYEWLDMVPERRTRYNEMKKLKAAWLAEESVEILDDLAGEDGFDNAQVSLAKARSEVRRWYASKLDRETFGSDAAVNLAVGIHNDHGALHVAALRKYGHMDREAMEASPLDFLPEEERRMIEKHRAKQTRERLIAGGLIRADARDRTEVQDAEYEIVDGEQ